MDWLEDLYDSFTHEILFGYVIWAPIFAVLAAMLVIRLLHVAKDHKRTKKYLNQQIVDYSTIAIIVFTACVWVIDVIAKFVFTSLK